MGTLAIIGDLIGAGGFASTIIFQKRLTSSLIGGVGAFDSFARTSEATVEEFDGFTKIALAEEARFSGTRRVENILPFPEDFSNAAWVGVGISRTSGQSDPDGGTNAWRLKNTDGGAQQIEQAIIATGDVTSNSCWVRRITGTGNIGMMDGSIFSTSVNIASVISDGEWHLISVAQGVTCILAADAGFEISTSGDEIDVYHPQYENSKDQANQNPSEYVSTDVLSVPYHGANVDGVKYFKTLNYNEVTSNVVGTLAVTGAGTQQLADPDFDTDNTTSDGTGSDWLWSSSEWSITGNALTTTGFAKFVKTRLTYEEDTYLRVKWTVDVALGSMFLGSYVFPKTAGSHDVILRVPSTPGDLTIQSASADPSITNFEITPITSIPDDFLEGYLSEEDSTNEQPESTPDSSKGSWTLIGNTTEALADAASLMQGETLTKIITGADTNPTIDSVLTGLAVSTRYEPSFYLDKGDIDVATLLLTDTVGAGSWTITLANMSDDVERIHRDHPAVTTITTEFLTSAGGAATTRLAGAGVTVGNFFKLGGFQVEEAEYPTSYMPTSTGTFSRVADVLQYEPPAYLQATVEAFTLVGTFNTSFDPAQYTASVNALFEIEESASERIRVHLGGAGNFVCTKVVGGASTTRSTSPLAADTEYKFAFRYDGATIALFLNGAQNGSSLATTTDPAFTVSVSNIFIGSLITSLGQASLFYKNWKIYSEGLSDAKCESLTS